MTTHVLPHYYLGATVHPYLGISEQKSVQKSGGRFATGEGLSSCDQTEKIVRDWLEWSEHYTGVKLPISSFEFYFGDEAEALKKKHLPEDAIIHLS